MERKGGKKAQRKAESVRSVCIEKQTDSSEESAQEVRDFGSLPFLKKSNDDEK